jgi:hypothetical protein
MLGTYQQTRGATGSALARLEAAIGLVDHIGPATATDNAVIPVTAFERLEAIANLHGSSIRGMFPPKI